MDQRVKVLAAVSESRKLTPPFTVSSDLPVYVTAHNTPPPKQQINKNALKKIVGLCSRPS